MNRQMGLLVFPGFQILDLVATTVFELANSFGARPQYEVALLSEHGGLVTSSSGVPVGTERFGSHAFDTVMVVGSLRPAGHSQGFLDFLREASKASRRTASICTGALSLAAAGLLDGRRATTHWCAARELQRRHPRVRVEEDRIFINDGSFWTSAGMTACIDLCLALVEADVGPEISRQIARKMVVYHRRSGGQSQFSALLELEPKSDRIQSALSYAKSNLRKALSVDELADVANLSRRQFSRSFRLETGQSPARAVEVLRVEAARALIEKGSFSIDAVARETGFGEAERMRRAFLRAYGQPPQAIRRTVRREAAA